MKPSDFLRSPNWTPSLDGCTKIVTDATVKEFIHLELVTVVVILVVESERKLSRGRQTKPRAKEKQQHDSMVVQEQSGQSAAATGQFFETEIVFIQVIVEVNQTKDCFLVSKPGRGASEAYGHVRKCAFILGTTCAVNSHTGSQSYHSRFNR
ncbi:uncharacterized protein V6R79_014897 [Siganus canaliculatus]